MIRSIQCKKVRFLIMLDINFIRNHQQDLSLIANQKGINISIERIIQLDFERRKLIHDIELARFTKRNYLMI